MNCKGKWQKMRLDTLKTVTACQTQELEFFPKGYNKLSNKFKQGNDRSEVHL